MGKNNVEEVKDVKVLDAENIDNVPENNDGDGIDEETKKDLEQAMKMIAAKKAAKEAGKKALNIAKKAALLGAGICIGGLLFKNKGSTGNDAVSTGSTDAEDITVDEGEDTAADVTDVEENA